MRAAIRVAVEISTNLFNSMFFGGICGVGSGSDGSHIGLVLIVVVVTVSYLWSNNGDGGDGGDGGCCNGGNCDEE